MKAMRRPLFWYSLAMWVVSLVIAGFLIQLGGLVMSDVPTAGARVAQADFINTAALEQVDAEIAALQAARQTTAEALEDARFLRRSRDLDYENQRATFESWVKTRTATGSADQNAEVVARVEAIEALRNQVREAERAVEAQEQADVAQRRALDDLRVQRADIVAAANAPFRAAEKREVLKVFLLRLALTLPLLLVSAWLVYRKRGSRYWPIYRSFVLFSLFAFFVELVPYLPSYGGYVRNGVGVVLALLFALLAIRAMGRYLEKKKSEERKSESEKRSLIEYETAVKKISSGVCPSCDRQFALQKPRRGETVPMPEIDYCVHCGFCLFDKCANCGARENSFFKFCGACGVPSEPPEQPAA